ncbi:AAA family ATPase [Elizabethkingia meningoseptica]|uniref:AAA family ATPase n=1 Tax=Elizabethkingia meningoseptica TaxID=238 RepID=UPI0023AE716B|nr:ATP-binding cassette domain-containing protein [Elizabethkingia meningoseptica]MDE5429417.1 ATP-binding protein [Elizabethkingia meningoseptica]
MKRITKVEIENCRAYYKEYNIELPKGENLLIYGENGSGKSSLFKSFHHFFKNSISAQTFSKNLFNQGNDGKIALTFSEIKDQDKSIVNSDSYKFSNIGSDNNVDFIKESSLLNGFLDYTDLLKIYLKSEPNPNLFNLIILNLLKEFIPVQTGDSTSIGAQYEFLIKNLITDAKTRNSRCHKFGRTKIPGFYGSLRIILDSIFELVNDYLRDFFDLKDISIEYILKPIVFKYPNHYRSSWYLETDLRLKVLKNGQELGNEYKDYLNEARLSSVAVCLYLASLKLFPSQISYKLIYLDDIFIGLDTSNRIPIINILNKHFNDYQIFISTYDKNFFEVCNHILSKGKQESQWKSIEIYVGEFQVDALNIIDVPIVISNRNDLSKARFHLYNNEKPDYPASANYFRKYLESKLTEIFPNEIFRDNNFEIIDSYKLTKIFSLCRDLLHNLDINIPEFEELNSYLFILLHPLSHYNTSIHTYKRDLKEIDNRIKFLFEDSATLDFLNQIKYCASRTTIQVEFYINKYNVWYYEFYIKKPLFFNPVNKKFSKCEVIGTKIYYTKNNISKPAKELNKGTSKIRYNSVEASYDGITNLIADTYRFFERPDSIFEKVKLFDGANWQNIQFKKEKKTRKKKNKIV